MHFYLLKKSNGQFHLAIVLKYDKLVLCWLFTFRIFEISEGQFKRIEMLVLFLNYIL